MITGTTIERKNYANAANERQNVRSVENAAIKQLLEMMTMASITSAGIFANYNNKMCKIVRCIISCVVLACALLMLINIDSAIKGYFLLMLAIYYFLFINVAKIDRCIYNPGMFLVNVTCIFRYVLIPLFYVLDSSYNFTSNLTSGIYLMLYEEVCVGVFLYYLVKKSYEIKTRTLNNVTINSIMKNEMNTQLRIGMIALVAIAVAIVIMNPSLLNEYNFAIGVEESDIISNYGSVHTMIISWSKMVFPLLIASFMINRYQKQPKFIYYILTVFPVLLFNLMLFKGISRNSVIVPGAASMFFLMRAFPKKHKMTSFMVSGMIVTVAIVLTLFKNSTANWVVDTIAAQRLYLNAYFAGPNNLGDAIGAYNLYKSSFSVNTLLNDLFYNVPGISQYFDGEDRITVLFNAWKGTQSAIVPAIGQGLFYFGMVLSVIPELVFLWMMSKFDIKARNANNIMEVFFYSYFAVRFGYTYYQNISILISFLLGTVITLTVLLKIFSNFKLRVRGNPRNVSVGVRRI